MKLMTASMEDKSKSSFVSVVICTYNRRNMLRDCLNSIYAQDYPKSNFEVIVVDGGSTDGTKELCKDFPLIRFIIESRLGLAYARNKGAELARGSIVAYTDDDCIVNKQWLKNLIVGFQVSESIVGVGGPVYPLHPEIIPRKILVKPALGLFDKGESVKLVRSLLTSNSAFKLEIFKTIKFDETLGVTRRGKLIMCGEDTDFCHSIISSGHKLLYTPHAKVYHQISKDRVRVPYMVRRAIHSGISSVPVLKKKKRSRIGAIKYSWNQLVQHFLQIPFNTCFASCYGLIQWISILFILFTNIDIFLIRRARKVR